MWMLGLKAIVGIMVFGLLPGSMEASEKKVIRCETHGFYKGKIPRTRFDLIKKGRKTKVMVFRETEDAKFNEIFRNVKVSRSFAQPRAQKLVAKSYTGRLDIIIRLAETGARASVVYDDMGLFADIRLKCKSLSPNTTSSVEDTWENSP